VGTSGTLSGTNEKERPSPLIWINGARNNGFAVFLDSLDSSADTFFGDGIGND
jgi:hypothetical protein